MIRQTISSMQFSSPSVLLQRAPEPKIPCYFTHTISKSSSRYASLQVNSNIRMDEETHPPYSLNSFNFATYWSLAGETYSHRFQFTSDNHPANPKSTNILLLLFCNLFAKTFPLSLLRRPATLASHKHGHIAYVNAMLDNPFNAVSGKKCQEDVEMLYRHTEMAVSTERGESS